MDRVATTRRQIRGEVQEDGVAEGRRRVGQELGHDPGKREVFCHGDSAHHTGGQEQLQEKGAPEC